MSVYPLPMRFPVPLDGSGGRRARKEGRDLKRDEYIDVTIDRSGWSFITTEDELVFRTLPVAQKLEYRAAFGAQVELAKQTH